MTPSRKRYQQIPTNTPQNQYNQRDHEYHQRDNQYNLRDHEYHQRDLQNQYNLTINDDTTQRGYAHGMCIAEMEMEKETQTHNTYHHRTTTNKQRIQHYHADGCQV